MGACYYKHLFWQEEQQSKHSRDGFNNPFGLWRSKNPKEEEEFAGVLPYVQSMYIQVRTTKVFVSKNQKSKISLEKKEVLYLKASTTFCKHICAKLVVYKLILKADENLYLFDVQTSYDALNVRCWIQVDKIYGTTWTHQDIKSKKKLFDAL